MIAKDVAKEQPHLHLLPPELLRYIFITCLQSGPPFTPYGVGSLPHVPLRIASVCQIWRQLALSTPELWSTCRLSYDKPERNTLWLARAGEQMLDLDGSSPNPPYYDTAATAAAYYYYDVDPHENRVNALFKSIQPYIERCQSLSLRRSVFPRDNLFGMNVPIPESVEFPNLLSFRLIEDGDDEENIHGYAPRWVHELLTTGLAPKLQCLKIGSWMQFWYQYDEVQPLQNLTKLDLSAIPGIHYVLAIITHATALQTLSVGDMSDQFDEDTGTPPITHKNLRTLSVDVDSNEGAIRILDNLTLPSLQTLSLRSFEFMRKGVATSLAAFILRSKCKIKEIAVEGMTTSTLDTLFRSKVIHDLRTFIAVNVSNWERLITLLSDTSNLPYLQELELRMLSNQAEVPPSAILEMLINRRNSVDGKGTKLQSFQLSQHKARWFKWMYGRRRAAFASIMALAADDEQKDSPLTIRLLDDNFYSVTGLAPNSRDSWDEEED